MSISQYNNIFSKTFPKELVLEFSDDVSAVTTIRNDQICEESMSLEESLCSDTNLKYGTCESSCFKVRVVNNNNFKGLKLNVSMVLKGVDAGRLIDSEGNYLVDSDDNYLTYYDASNPDSATIDIGEYFVVDDQPSNDRMWRDLTCYDALHFILNADVSAWYATLTFPMSMRNFRNSFFTWINTNVISISQNTVSLINDNFMIQGGFEATQLSGKDIIESICELNACFGHIDSSGNFDYITLPSAETITYNWYIDGTGIYEDYVTEEITKIIARGEADDVGTSVGTDGNIMIIENNPLIFGTEGTAELEDALDNILDAVEQFNYRPFSVDTYGNPMMPLGTSIVINTKRYDPENGYQRFTINSFVMNRTLSGVQALKDSISADGDMYYPSEVNSVTSDVKRLKGKMHIFRNTLDELYSEINDADTGIVSVISQLSDEIVLKVDSSGKIRKTALDTAAASGSEFKVTEDNISFITSGTIEMTANNLEINSTNFQVDSDGNVTCDNITANDSGSIGGWQIEYNRLYYESDSDNYISLYSFGKRIEIVSGGLYKFEAGAGSIGFYYDNNYTAGIRSEYWSGTASGSNLRGVGINVKPYGSFIDLGYEASGGSGTSVLTINNGLNPNGITQKLIFQVDSYSRGQMYFSTYNYIGRGDYTYNQTAYHCLWNNSHVYVGGHLFINSNLDLEGYVLGRLQFMSTSDYINKGTWTMAGSTYHGLYLNRNIFTDGVIFAEGGIRSWSGFVCGNDTVVVDATSNNHVTGSSIYRGLGITDSSTNLYRYVEFFGAADTDGTTRGYIYSKNMTTSGTEVANQLGCGVKKDGTRTYYVTDPASFRSTIGVNGIGDTSGDNSATDETCNSGAWKSVSTIASLPAGKYLLIGTADITGNSNGNRYMVISNGIDGTQISRHARVSAKNPSGRTALQIVCPINISSATTYHLNVYQDSGSALTASGRLTAIKIKG